MSLQPPKAPVRPVRRSLHGQELVDDYAWLTNREDPAVIAHLEAENRYTEAQMAPTERLQSALYAEMLARIQETDLTVPVRIDAYLYYARTEQGLQYPIYCRKLAPSGDEEVLVDVNLLAEGESYLKIGAVAHSPDHRLLAYSTDADGSEQFTLVVKDLSSGELLTDRIPGTSYSLEWGQDNRTLFYTVLDDAHRPFKVLRHVLGTPVEADELIHHEPDERFFVGLEKTRSRRFILIHCGSQVTTEVRVLDAARPFEAPALFAERRQGVEYSLAHRGDSFYVLTNDQAINFRLLRVPIDRTDSLADAEELIPHRLDVKLEEIDLFEERMAVTRREQGLLRIEIWELETGERHEVSFPDPAYHVWTEGNAEFATRTLRFVYSSPLTPKSVYDYDMVSRERELKKQQEIPSGFDRDRYRLERIAATASDGTAVPLTVVSPSELVRDGSGACLLVGYGSYGHSLDPQFSTNIFSLLDRGVSYAIAHVRGGGELGRPWYEAGKLLRKKTTFSDFIACAEHLVEAGYTAHERLAIRGGSAGGLLIGAVINARPDLAAAAIADVPFVDVVHTMLDASLPLTVVEYEEWGIPNQKEFFDYIRSYSPYDNVRPGDYPRLLLTAGLNDPRVHYWEPAKLAAKLRALKTDDRPLLLKVNMGAGHGGASGRYDALREEAFRHAFLLTALGVVDPASE